MHLVHMHNGKCQITVSVTSHSRVVGVRYGTCFMSCMHLEYGGNCYISGIFVDPCQNVYTFGILPASKDTANIA